MTKQNTNKNSNLDNLFADFDREIDATAPARAERYVKRQLGDLARREKYAGIGDWLEMYL